MKYVKVCVVLLAILIFIAGALLSPRPYTETEYSMDTLMTVTAYGKNAKTAVKDVFSRIRELDKKLDLRNPESQVARLNQAPADTPVYLDEDVFYVIKTALLFSEKCGGAFDITLYPVSNLWGFGTDKAVVPEAEDIRNALLKTGSQNLVLDEEKQAITKKHSDAWIDLGGVAKGYAADEAIRILKEAGITSAYLDLGGNIGIIGEKPLSLRETIENGKASRPYTVGIQKPGAPRGELIDTVSLSEGFVVTSGDYERFFEEEGILYHHILNPETGFPADTGLKSVTIVSKSGILADMLSTTIFVQGKESADRYLNDCDTILLVDDHFDLTYIE